MKGLYRLADWVDAHSLRERVLLLLCAMAVMIGLWQLVLEWPKEQQRAQLRDALTRLETAQAETSAQMAALSRVSAHRGGVVNEDQRQALLQRKAALDEELAALSQGLISADQLPVLLQDVLASTSNLSLKRVRTLPVKPLRLGNDPDETPGLYQHSVVLQLSGNYFGVLEFLDALETLPWRFYWGRLDYRVTAYPNAQVELRVYTLSAKEGLFGV